MSNTIQYIISLRDMMSGTITNAQGKVKDFENSVQKLNGTISKIGAAIGVAFAINQISSFVSKVVEAGTTVEDATTGLTTLLKDQNAAAQVVKNTMEDAKKTPFEFKGLLAANRQLIAAGVNADTAREDVMNLANAVAASGQNNEVFERMTANLAQIKTVGKATATDIKQFGIAGINIYQVLAQSTGKSIEQVKEMSVSYEVLTDALKKAHAAGGMFEGGLEKMSANTSVKISNLQDYIFNTMVVLYEKLKPLVVFVLDGVATILDTVGKVVENLDLEGFVANAKALIMGVVDFVRPIFNALRESFIKISATIRQVFGDINQEGGKVANMIKWIQNIIVSVINVMTPIIQKIVMAFRRIFDAVYNVYAALSQFGSEGGSILSFIGDVVGWLVDIFAWWYETLMNVVATIIDVFHTVYVLLEKLYIIEAIKLLFNAVWEVLKWIGEGLAWVYDHTIKPVVDAIAWAYNKVKDLLGIKSVEVAATVTKEGKTETTTKTGTEVATNLTTGAGALGDKNLGTVPKTTATEGKGGKSETKGVTGSKSVTITIKIDKLIESFKIETRNMQESAGKIKEMVAQTMLSAVNDSQVTAGI